MSGRVSDYVGPDNWPGRWKAKAAALKAVDWSYFRQDPVLMEGIQTTPTLLPAWLKRCREEDVPPGVAADSGVGRPRGQNVVLQNLEVFATATSLKSAFHAEMIAQACIDMRGGRGVGPLHLEIGGGFGALAVALHRRIGTSGVYLADAQPMVEMQKRYIFDSAPGLTALELKHAREVDIVTNTMSFGEMELKEVSRYFALIKDKLVDGGLLYVANRIRRVTNFSDYPYGQGWRHIVRPFDDGKRIEPQYVICSSIRDRSADSSHPAELLRMLA